MSSFDFGFFADKTVGFFGIGKSNSDIIARLPKSSKVVIRSDTSVSLLPNSKAKIVATYTGKSAFDNPIEDILIFSPSVKRERPEFDTFRKRGVRFTSDCELFFENIRSPVFAVSGSDGKSTTATLSGMLLSEKFPRTITVGNVGTPMLSSLKSECSAYVAELSSFMLSYGKYRVFRAAITNISENHLDWHQSFDEYKNAKLLLFQRCEESVLNADDLVSAKFFENLSPWAVTSSVKAYKDLKDRFRAQSYYTIENGYVNRNGKRIIAVSEIRRNEGHNLANLLTSLALTDGYVSRDHVYCVAKNFGGLEHRSELFLSVKGMDFINSSIDSTPKRTAATLESIAKPVIIILGGKGKNLSYEPLKVPLTKWAKFAIICGENADEIEKCVKDCCKTLRANDPEEAAMLALEVMKSGDTLLLSPASTSFDKYINFEQRGQKFKEKIMRVFNTKDQNS